MIEHQYFEYDTDSFKAVRVTLFNCQEDDYDPVVELFFSGGYLYIINDLYTYSISFDRITKIELYDREKFIDIIADSEYYVDSNFETIFEVLNEA